MKKLISFITIIGLILSMFGNVYAEDAVEETVPNEVQEVVEETEQEETEQEVTEVVEETEKDTTETVEDTEQEETVYTLYELLPFKKYDDWSLNSKFGFDLYTEEESDLFYEYADKVKLTLYDGAVEEEKNNNNAYLIKHLEQKKSFYIYLFPEYVKIVNKIADGNFNNDISFYKYVSDYSDFVTDMQTMNDILNEWHIEELKKEIVVNESTKGIVLTTSSKEFNVSIGKLIDTENTEYIYLTNWKGEKFRINRQEDREILELALERWSYVMKNPTTISLDDEIVLLELDINNGKQKIYVTQNYRIYTEPDTGTTYATQIEITMEDIVNFESEPIELDVERALLKLNDRGETIRAYKNTRYVKMSEDFVRKNEYNPDGPRTYKLDFYVTLNDSYKNTDLYKYADENGRIYGTIERRLNHKSTDLYMLDNRYYGTDSEFIIGENNEILRVYAREQYSIDASVDENLQLKNIKFIADCTNNENVRYAPDILNATVISSQGNYVKLLAAKEDTDLSKFNVILIDELEEKEDKKQNDKNEENNDSTSLTDEQQSELKVSGIMVGDPDGNLRLEDTITRAETVKVLCTATDMETNVTENMEEFSDVGTDHWAYEYINKAQGSNIINGYGDSTFKPANSVTYNEFIKMLVCVIGYADEAEEKGGYPNGYIAVAEEIGITEGIVFEGDDEVTRNDVGIMILNVLDILN